MKPAAAILLFSVCCLHASAQEPPKLFLQTSSKAPKYYIVIHNDVALAYEMGIYFDKSGDNRGAAVLSMDTLHLQPDGAYLGYASKIVKKNDAYYLTEGSKKRARALDTVKDKEQFNFRLNNAYFLKRYFAMCREVNDAYPLQHSTFRNGYRAWQALPNKTADVAQFRGFTDQRIIELKDSIGRSHDRYTAVTGYVRQHLDSMEYDAIKEKLAQLLAERWNRNRYYVVVINEVAKRKPAYFFRLAEDFPGDKTTIFYAVEKDKAVMQGLKAVDGYTATKNDFFKVRK